MTLDGLLEQSKPLCQHQLFKVRNLNKIVNGSPSFRSEKEGVLLICGLCGETREVWEDGTVIIKPRNYGQAYSNNTSGTTAKNSTTAN